MATDILYDDPATALRRFVPYDTAIATMHDQYMGLTCNGIADVKGFQAVHQARMVVKGKRVEVEKVRKELKADALEYGRKVDAEAKRITALLEPIETHLLQQEEAVEAERERIRETARLKAEAEARAIEEERLAKEQAEREAEEELRRVQREAEEAAIRAEREKIEADRRALEAERAAAEAERRAAQEKIDAERKALEAEQRRHAEEESLRKREIELEQARKEAAEQAKRDMEERIARQAAEEQARKEAEESARIEAAFEEAEARRKAEALRPDREKLLAVAAAVSSIEVPVLSSMAGSASKRVHTVLFNATQKIAAIAAQLDSDTGEETNGD
jgi:chromosome segregation ATPase